MPTFPMVLIPLAVLVIPMVALPQDATAGQDIVKNSTIKAIYEMPRCTARDSKWRKICDDIGEQRDKG